MYSEVDYGEEKYVFVRATLVCEKFLLNFCTNYRFVISCKEMQDNGTFRHNTPIRREKCIFIFKCYYRFFYILEKQK